MKTLAPIACLLLLSGSLLAQTKLIAHKSHGGSNQDFNKALTTHRSLQRSNLGVAPMREVPNANLDSVIYVNDTTVIMVTSYAFGIKSTELTNESGLCELTSAEDWRYEQVDWSPGRDTVINHHVFSDNLTVAEMRETLDRYYYFKNDISEVKFVNFPDDKSEGVKRNKIMPFDPESNPKGPWTLIFVSVIIFGFAFKGERSFA